MVWDDTTLAEWQFFRTTWVIRYRNVTILDFIGAKDDRSGGDNCHVPVPPANQHPAFYRPDALPVAQPTLSEH